MWLRFASALNAASAIVLLGFRIPLFGRLAGQGVRLLQEAVARLSTIIDPLLRVFGVRLQRTLRLYVVVLRAAGTPVVPNEALLRQIQTAENVLTQAGIRLAIAGIHADDRDAPASALDTGCNARAYWEDLWLPGCFFEATAQRHASHTAFRRLIGFGSPLFAFVVRSMAGCSIGCSLGAAADYVTLDARAVGSIPGQPFDDPTLLMHEIGHALGLLHRIDRGNLMTPLSARGSALTGWQIAVMRGSRHVGSC